MNKITVFILLTLLYSCSLVNADKVELGKLTVEGRISPTGIDVETPRFGWQIVSNEHDVHQQSYHLLVASSLENINRNVGDVWDSGEVQSDASQWVDYQSSPLQANKEYYWKVRVTTNRGTSDWSQPERWSTGMMDGANWKGDWIGLDSLMPGEEESGHSRLASRYLRKEFHTAKPIKRATMHISGLGLYTLYINGTRVGNDVLTPIPTDYQKTVVYNSYDVTDLLGKDNAIGVVLGNGRYFFPVQNVESDDYRSFFYKMGYPKLLANLMVEYADGTTETVYTDNSWRLTADGPVRYSSEYDGELYDARQTMDGWDAAGFDDSHWMQARRVPAPGGVLRGNLSPAMHVYATEKPVRITRFANRYIVDFGTNNAGRIRMNYQAANGDTVRIRHAEQLEPGDSTLFTANLRTAQQTTYYVGDGKPHTWTPEFSYYGFRYAEVTGVENLNVKDITRELIADAMDDKDTEFYVEETDGESLLNTLVANARRGVRSGYKGMPVDCPQRDERQPWLGDRTTGCFGESYLINNHDLYAKWAADIRESQLPDGNISDVAPVFWKLYSGNVTWPAALPFACDMLYRQYGDLKPMRDNYQAIKRFLAFIRTQRSDGKLITYDRYGDWCVPPESPELIHSQDPARRTDGQLIASTYYYYLCRLMQRYAPIVGEEADAAYYAKEAEQMRQAVNASFLKAGNYANGTVTANLLPLAMQMVPENERSQVESNLLHTIVEKNDTHISTGVIGIQWLMRYLSDSGHGDIAYQLATTDTYPSWGYMVRQGATTIWELWNGDTGNPYMNSGNHVMLLGDLLVWCYERVGGIRADESHPGFKHIILKPDFSITQLKSVRASHHSPYGTIRSAWQREGDRISWQVTVPTNTTAEVYLPDGSMKEVGSGEYEFMNTLYTTKK